MLRSRSKVRPGAGHSMSWCLACPGLLVHLHDFVVVVLETDLDSFECCVVVSPLCVCIP